MLRKIHLGLLFIMFFNGVKLTAQKTGPQFMGTIGVSSPILDNGVGLHLGINPYITLTPYLTTELQASYNFTKITSSFISGRLGSVHSMNLLAGPRIYIFPKDWNARMYLSLMLGYFRSSETYAGSNEKTIYAGFGGSSGIYLEWKSWVGGIAVEGPQFVVFKIGKTF